MKRRLATMALAGLLGFCLPLAACSTDSSPETTPFHSLENYTRRAREETQSGDQRWDRSAMILLGEDLYLASEFGSLAGTAEYEQRKEMLLRRGTLLGSVRRQVDGDSIPDLAFSSNAEAVGTELYALPEKEDEIYAMNARIIVAYRLLETNYRPDNGFDEAGNVIPRE